ncbi:unnamed protein product [Notodromas monacha]|uniref:T-complex protein 1 subunit zeta n=1 Tax=Notodromas monacha TaxID=399045 RepID=A0A7R9GFR5_9CRUS|nr:unnamed protein product [Notodromas monacha]CAG0919432.1 unnamed protein product [Notodromas monacha]
MSAISALNPKAEVARATQSLAINISAAKSIQEIMKTNLGPKGTMKMLVSGAGDIKITKDGNILLHEMQIQHPTASLIARASTAQDDITGDGTTSTVLLIGEMLKQADSYIAEGLHPRVVSEGFEIARKKCLEYMEVLKLTNPNMDKATLLDVARSSLRTKVEQDLADKLADICVDAVLTIRRSGGGDSMVNDFDLHMIEIMEMQHKSDDETQLVRGLVMDHGGRHPDMKKRVENAFILTCNVSLEYEKSEVNAGFFYKSAEERENLVKAERDFTDQRVRKIIELKKKVLAMPGNEKKGFVVINQKGIDPLSLDMLAKEGILALRRAKRRNMERIPLACGGVALNSFDEISVDDLGYAGVVYEHVLGENKYTFIEELQNPKSVTILVKGPTKYVINQIKDALRDGLRAIKNALDDGCVLPGAGAFEIGAHRYLLNCINEVKGRSRLGYQAFADALLVIPKTLAGNAGYDVQDTIVKLQETMGDDPKKAVGVNLDSGEPIVAQNEGILDNFCVKKQLIDAAALIASNLLLVDEIMPDVEVALLDWLLVEIRRQTPGLQLSIKRTSLPGSSYGIYCSATYDLLLQCADKLHVMKPLLPSMGGGTKEFSYSEAEYFIGVQDEGTFLTSQERQAFILDLLNNVRFDPGRPSPFPYHSIRWHEGQPMIPKLLAKSLIRDIVPMHEEFLLFSLRRRWVQSFLAPQPLGKCFLIVG